jgi:NADH-quinone oxidoreductase subunit J
MIELIFFAIFSIVALCSAVSLVLQRNPIYSALSLIVVIASIGGLFVLLQATFLAVLQLIIYAGAIMALFLFVIMMVDVQRDLTPAWQIRSVSALVILLMIAVCTIWAVATTTSSFHPLAADFTVTGLARSLFTTYLFPFEAIAVLIVSSVIGALYIARKETA